MRGNNFLQNSIQFVWWSRISASNSTPILLLLIFFLWGAPAGGWGMKNNCSGRAREVSYFNLHILSRRCMKESRVQPSIQYSMVQNITWMHTQNWPKSPSTPLCPSDLGLWGHPQEIGWVLRASKSLGGADYGTSLAIRIPTSCYRTT